MAAMGFGRNGAWRPLWAGFALVYTACGARTPLDGQHGDSDASVVVDSGLVDAQVLDAFVLTDSGPPDSGVFGRSCLRRSDCDGLVCGLDPNAELVDLDAVPLICENPLGLGQILADCETGADCASGLCLFVGTCAEPCVADIDCAELSVDSSPRCAQTYVVTSDTTMQSLMTCGQGVSLPEGVVRRSLTTERLDFEGAVTLDGPGGLYLLDHRDAAETFFFGLSSDTEVLCDFSTFGPGSARPINPFSPGVSFSSVFVPSGSRELADSRYVLNYQSLESRGTAAISHFSRSTGSPRVLHFNIVRIGAGRGDLEAQLRDEVENAARVYLAQLGLRGVIDHYSTFVGGLARRYSILGLGDDGGESELEPLFELTHGARDAAVTLFFVRDIDGAIGIAGGAPGAQVMHGTPASGIAIARDASLLGGAEVSVVVAHEAGHYLGLFHTSEADGSQLEALNDTPECPPDFDLNGDGFVDPSECADTGATNVMFWSGDGAVLSADQARSAQRALLLRGD